MNRNTSLPDGPPNPSHVLRGGPRTPFAIATPAVKPLLNQLGAMNIASSAQPTRRVALLLESDGPGGAEIMLIQIAEELRRRGYGVLPVGPAKGCGWLGGELRARGFETATFTLRRPLDPACARGLADLFRERRIDAAHSHEFTMAVYGAAAARAVGIPHVITMHGSQYVMAKWRRRAALKWAFRRSREVIAVSGATQEHLLRELHLSKEKVRVIPNGIHFEPGERARVRAELRLPDDAPLVIAVGNLVPRKGHIHLLRAMAALTGPAAKLPWHVAIAGRGTEEGPLRDFAASAGIADRVHVLGHRGDIPDLLAAADIYTMPSLWEGLPVALLEAMFARKPVIASRVSGIPEAINDGVHGLLSEPGDAESLRRALERLLVDPSLRERMASAAQERAQQTFSVGVMTEQYERAYGFRR